MIWTTPPPPYFPQSLWVMLTIFKLLRCAEYFVYNISVQHCRRTMVLWAPKHTSSILTCSFPQQEIFHSSLDLPADPDAAAQSLHYIPATDITTWNKYFCHPPTDCCHPSQRQTATIQLNDRLSPSKSTTDCHHPTQQQTISIKLNDRLSHRCHHPTQR